MNWNKMTKAELLELAKELKVENEVLKSKGEDYDRLNEKYKILVDARKEDKEKIQEAEKVTRDAASKEQEIVRFYVQQINQLQNSLNEQNETIANLFEMVDTGLAMQKYYYEKYKSVFVADNKKEE